MTASERRTILVTGDIICDHHIYEGSRLDPAQMAQRGIQTEEKLGGAALLHHVIRSVFEAAHRNWNVSLGVDPDSLARLPNPFHAYAVWRPFPLKHGANKDAPSVWRVAQALGYGDGPFHARHPGEPTPIAGTPPEIVVLDDAGLGFRFEPSKKHWPIAAQPQSDDTKWIVLKLSNPIAEGDLWRMLVATCDQPEQDHGRPGA